MGLWTRLRNSFEADRIHGDAADELAHHLELRTQEYVRQGLTPEAAGREAKRKMGNETFMRENTVDADTSIWFETLRRDVKAAGRTFKNAPLFAVMAILSLALGIGANTMVFTVMKHVVMDALPVPNAGELVILHDKGIAEGHVTRNGIDSSFSYPLYRDLAPSTSSVFSGLLARFDALVTFSARTGSEFVHCELASSNYFDVLEVKPWRGRFFSSAMGDEPGKNPYVVLGYGFWQRKFGGNPNILNQTVRLNSHSFVVIGIAPPSFYGIDLGTPSDIFVPISNKAQITPGWDGTSDRLDRWASLIGRLKPGVTMAQAETGLKTIYTPLVNQDLAFVKTPSPTFRREFTKSHVQLAAGGKGYADVRETLRSPLQFMAAMVAIVLLITVVNVANLLIARAAARQREMAIRLSVGASKFALIRQLLVESCALALAGGVVGVAFAYVATPPLLRLLSSDLNTASLTAGPDLSILLITTAVTVLCGFAFGLLPAWQAGRTDVSGALKAEASHGNTGQRLWVRRALVTGQMAFSMLLLSLALLFSRSLGNLQKIDTGFRVAGLLTFKIDPSGVGYNQAQTVAAVEEIQQRVGALPGTEAAAFTTTPILEDMDRGAGLAVEGYKGSEETTETRRNGVSQDFLRTMKIPLLRGRDFTESEIRSASHVGIVNQTFVKKFIPDRDPIGVHFAFHTGNPKLDWTIIGVVKDNAHTGLRTKIEPFVFEPYTVDPHLTRLNYYVRSRGEPAALATPIQDLVRRFDTNLPITDLKTLDAVINERLFAERGLGVLSTGFAALATILAIIGIYGVMTYSVARREREFGVRMAIGANPRSILQIVLRESLLVGSAGVLLAIPVVLSSGKMLESALYAVKANDPIVCSAAAILLIGVAALAGALPAIRASRIDPRDALRAE